MKILSAMARAIRRRRRRVVAPAWPQSITIESSSICNLACRMCPRSAETFEAICAETPPFLTPELFDRIEPWLDRFAYVDLTGWGEPLMNPHIIDFVQRVKKRGPQVSFITNGSLLDAERGATLLEAGVDFLTVSCDAGQAETYEAVRGADRFDALIENLSRFRQERDRRGRNTCVNWAYVMMKSNIGQLPEAVEWAGRCGIDRISVKHMETALDDDNLAQALFDTRRVALPTEKENQYYVDMIHQARLVADRYPRLEFVMAHPPFDPNERTCLARPNENVVLDTQGNLAPCCYTLPADTRPYQTERSQEQKTFLLGNVWVLPMDRIFAAFPYRAFSRAFSGGGAPEPCLGCIQLARRPGRGNKKQQ